MFTTKEELKRFFRERVKELHPDRGGDPESFMRFLTWYRRKLSSLSDELEVAIVKNPIPSGNAIYKLEEFTVRELALALPKKIKLPIEERVCGNCKGSGVIDVEEDRRLCKACGGLGILRMQNALQEYIELRCTSCQGKGYTSSRVCPSCSGKGRIRQEKEILVSIPPGLRDGDILFVSGRPFGLKSNIYIEVVEKPHPHLRLTKDSLIYTLTVPFHDLLLKETISIETLEGPEEIPSERLRQGGPVIFPKRGPFLNSADGVERGDLILEVKVTFPDKISARARRYLQKFIETLEVEKV